MTPRFLAAIAVLSSGCAIGGRLTGGVLAGPRGASGFVSARFVLGLVDHRLGRSTLEIGVTESERRPASHVGLRYAPGRDGATAWTAATAAEWSRDGGFGQVSAGISIETATLTHESPDALGARVLGVDIEGVAVIGGRHIDDLAPELGVQISFELLELALMR